MRLALAQVAIISIQDGHLGKKPRTVSYRTTAGTSWPITSPPTYPTDEGIPHPQSPIKFKVRKQASELTMILPDVKTTNPTRTRRGRRKGQTKIIPWDSGKLYHIN
jgi:hypothetical protein